MGEVTEGEWKGWLKWMPGDPFEDHVGPFYARRDPDGDGDAMVCAFRPKPHNCNGGGMIHGGTLMTFADYALFMVAGQSGEMVHGVTVTFNSEFVGPAKCGEMLTARGEIVRAGKSLVFLRGLISGEAGPVLAFSGTIKRIR
jgi:uncharacterized protein (TIGR00369 family)